MEYFAHKYEAVDSVLRVSKRHAKQDTFPRLMSELPSSCPEKLLKEIISMQISRLVGRQSYKLLRRYRNFIYFR